MVQITITISGGHLATGGAFHSALANVMPSVQSRVAEVFHDNSPIGETGQLHDSWHGEGGGWEGFAYNAPVVNTAQNKGYYYARRVNIVSRRNAGYIERALEPARVAALARLRDEIAQVARTLWQSGGAL